MNREQLTDRLQQLNAEKEKGMTRMEQLDQQRQSLQHTLLRIDGAMQVLNELLANDEQVDTRLARVKAL
jgi:prefoldin subunit 5